MCPKSVVVLGLVFPPVTRKTRVQFPAAEFVHAVLGAVWRVQRVALLHLAVAPCAWPQARVAQSAERKALNLVVVGSSPTVGVLAGLVLSMVVVFWGWL